MLEFVQRRQRLGLEVEAEHRAEIGELPSGLRRAVEHQIFHHKSGIWGGAVLAGGEAMERNRLPVREFEAKNGAVLDPARRGRAVQHRFWLVEYDAGIGTGAINPVLEGVYG